MEKISAASEPLGIFPSHLTDKAELDTHHVLFQLLVTEQLNMLLHCTVANFID